MDNMVGGPKDIKRVVFIIILVICAWIFWISRDRFLSIKESVPEFFSKLNTISFTNSVNKPLTDAESLNLDGLHYLYIENDYTKAEDFFRKSISASPSYSAAYNNLGITLDKVGRYDEAIGYFLEAIKINPNYAKAYNNLGISYKNKNQLDEAKEAYLKAMQLDDKEINAWTNMGMIYMNWPETPDDYKKARYYYEEAIKRGAQEGWIKKDLENLEKVGY
jgi:Flp pilus assembly protein TadD